MCFSFKKSETNTGKKHGIILLSDISTWTVYANLCKYTLTEVYVCIYYSFGCIWQENSGSPGNWREYDKHDGYDNHGQQWSCFAVFNMTIIDCSNGYWYWYFQPFLRGHTLRTMHLSIELPNAWGYAVSSTKSVDYAVNKIWRSPISFSMDLVSSYYNVTTS